MIVARRETRCSGVDKGRVVWSRYACLVPVIIGLFLLGLVSGPGGVQAAQTAKKKAATGQKPVSPQAKVELEPKAIDLLKATSNRLASARTMSFTALISYESPSRIGPPLLYTTTSDVIVQRPDKFRVITPGDGPASEFYYDGKQMIAFSPADNLAAIAQAPPTIDGALKAAYDTGAIYFPFADVIVADPYKDLADRLQVAFYIGQSRIVGGTTTDMVAFVTDRVFAQIWIGAEDKLPRRLRAVYKDDPSKLRHQMDLMNWQLDVTVPPGTFEAKIGNAKHIPFERPEPKSLPRAKGANGKMAK